MLAQWLMFWLLLLHTGSAFRPAAIWTSAPRASVSVSTTQLSVSIGLGPEPDKTDEDRPKVAGVDYMVPNHDAHRLDRRSKLDEQCDAWFAGLLLGTDTNNGACRGPIAEQVQQLLTQPVALTNELEHPDRNDEAEWTPYVTTKLPWSVLHPAYGLEQFGLPVPRRNAETWRHFDVAGMVNIPMDGSLKATLSLNDDDDDETVETLRQALITAGSWLDDDECSARLVYVNGVYCRTLSIESDSAKNYDSTEPLSDELQSFVGRLTDGWTDELVCPVPMQQGDSLTSFATLSGPNHKVGAASSQFAINTQQGTACFAALNTLQCQNIAVVHETTSKDVDVPTKKPVLIVHALTADGGVDADAADAATGVACHPRTVIVADEGAHASVVQQSVSLTSSDDDDDDDSDATNSLVVRPTLYNGYTQVWLKDRANVTHTVLEETGGMPVSGVEQANDQQRAAEASRPALQNTVFETLDVHCAGYQSHYSGTVLSMGGTGRTRMATSISLLKPESSCTLNGFSLAGGTCRSDLKTSIHHIADGCQSRQLQKNMVAGRATTSFRGRIRVEQSAQQTDSQQLSRTVLLTDKARAWAVPSLEIIADDVQCTHGATVSDLSEEELFYLRSRGLGTAAARNLLMYAFCNDVVGEVPPAVLGEFTTLDSADAAARKNKDDKDVTHREGLQLRILRRLNNLVPTGNRAVKGEYQSI